MESSLSIKVSTKFEAPLGRVGERLVSGLNAARACRLVAEEVMPLTSEPPVMMFTTFSGVGFASCSSQRVSRWARVFLPLSKRKSWR